MAYSPSSPITGSAQTGFTAPTYTFVSDVAPSIYGVQKSVSALGGTQVGVDVHSISRPFTLTVERPAVFKQLGQPNPVTGLVKEFPRNVFKVRTRKGVTPLAAQPSQVFEIITELRCIAGADTADPANIRAALSAHFGLVTQVSAGLGDSMISGVL